MVTASFVIPAVRGRCQDGPYESKVDRVPLQRRCEVRRGRVRPGWRIRGSRARCDDRETWEVLEDGARVVADRIIRQNPHRAGLPHEPEHRLNRSETGGDRRLVLDDLFSSLRVLRFARSAYCRTLEKGKDGFCVRSSRLLARVQGGTWNTSSN